MHLRKINWKSGSGEALGFTVVAPILLLITLFILNMYIISDCEQKLIYASYKAGRQAVIQYDCQSANEAMKNELDAIYGGSAADHNVTWDLGIKDDIYWEKGNVTLITVTQELKAILPLGNGPHTRSIGMMIEHSKWTNE